MRLFISAGEASGDAYGARLLAELKPDVEVVQAIGGARLAAAGAEVVADSSGWGALGFIESARVAPRVMRGLKSAKTALADDTPGVFVPIDFGYINVRLARFARRHGWKVLYFIPPGSWRRTKQGADIPEVADEVVTPFPWSAEMLRAMGASAHFFGHPLKQLVREAGAAPERDEQIAVLPGSRSHEVVHNLEPVARALLSSPALAARKVEFALAPTVDAEWLRETWSGLAPGRGDDLYTRGDVYGVLRRSAAAVVCSGTATLEAALCMTPHVVIYRGSKLMEIEYRIRKPRFQYISLPNILLERKVVEELIQERATPEAIAAILADLLAGGPAAVAQLEAFAELDRTLGGADAITRTAELVRSLRVG